MASVAYREALVLGPFDICDFNYVTCGSIAILLLFIDRQQVRTINTFLFNALSDIVVIKLNSFPDFPRWLSISASKLLSAFQTEFELDHCCIIGFFCAGCWLLKLFRKSVVRDRCNDRITWMILLCMYGNVRFIVWHTDVFVLSFHWTMSDV